MKVLLIAPYVSIAKVGRKNVNINREDFYPSAALLHLAAILRVNNHVPIIVDLNNSVVHSAILKSRQHYLDYCKNIIIESLNEYKPDLIGINCLFSRVFPDVLEFAKTIKLHSPQLKIAIGGIHPTSYYKEILTNCKEINYIAIGEGENSIVALAAAIQSKNENLISQIKSFAYRDEEGVVKFNKETNYIEDLDKLPMPAWDLINIKKFEMKLDNYYNPKNLQIKNKAAIFSSRACPLACNFCDMFLVMGKKHRKRSVKTIVNEIELLNKDYGINYFSFMDDQLTLNRSHIMGLCNEIIKRKLNIQFDTPNGVWINSLREEVIAKMAEAGLTHTNLAIEHGDDYLRNKVIGKNLERKKIFETANWIKKYQIMSTGSFIMGFPEETNETLSQTYEMMEELQLDTMNNNTLIPLPGTALFNQVIKDNLLLHEWKLDELWKTPMSLEQDRFLIKPYNMKMDDLYKWREKFDIQRNKYWKTNNNNPIAHEYSSHKKTYKRTSPLIFESIN